MELIDFLYFVILPVLVLSALLVFVRFALGPSISDRVVALDLLLTIGLGVIAVYAVYTNQPHYLDIAMILGLIAFLGTVAFSYYIEKRQENG
jgi:multicomponent Na+:H+ antiporter subunit F